MKIARAKLSAIVIAAVIGSVGASLFADVVQAACPTAPQHHCGKMAPVITCCCGVHGEPANQGGPIESRVRPNPNLTLVATITATAVPNGRRAIGRPHDSPRPAPPLDLPTRFSSLLI